MTDEHLLHSAGDAMVGLVRDRHHPDRMAALMTFTDRNSGRRWQVHLLPTELRDILGDALRLLTADEREVSTWWAALAPTHPGGRRTLLHGEHGGRKRAPVTDDGMYLEVLAAFGDGSDVRCHVVRGLTPRSLAELGCELFDAETNGDDLDDVLSAWAVVYE